MTKEVVENIYDTIGEVSRSIGGGDEDGGSFIRVRVTLDISLSLCKGRLVSFENGKVLGQVQVLKTAEHLLLVWASRSW